MTDVHRHWVRHLRRGTRLVFWVVAVSAVLTSTGAVAVAVLTGTRAGLQWVAFVPMFAELLLLAGVYALTAPVSCPRDIRTPDAPRQLLRVCAVLAVLGQLGRFLAVQMQTWPRTPYVWAGERLLESLAILLFFLYLRGLAVRFHEARISRSVGSVAWLAATANLLLVFNLENIYEDVGVSLSTYQALFWSRASFRLVVWIWVLRVLWRFSSEMPRAADGRCSNCGYTLKGLDSQRCPECGMQF